MTNIAIEFNKEAAKDTDNSKAKKQKIMKERLKKRKSKSKH